MEASYDTKQNEPMQLDEDSLDYYYRAEMANLTDGSSNEQADFALPVLEKSIDDGVWDDPDPYFSDEPSVEAEHRPVKRLYRDLENGRNLNNSFGCYDLDDWDHLHVDKGVNPQFANLRI